MIKIQFRFQYLDFLNVDTVFALPHTNQFLFLFFFHNIKGFTKLMNYENIEKLISTALAATIHISSYQISFIKESANTNIYVRHVYPYMGCFIRNHTLMTKPSKSVFSRFSYMKYEKKSIFSFFFAFHFKKWFLFTSLNLSSTWHCPSVFLVLFFIAGLVSFGWMAHS